MPLRLVQSSTVQIQGRLGSTHTEGLPATHQIVAGVPVLKNGHKFELSTIDPGVLTVNLVPRLSDPPSFSTGAGFTSSYVALCAVADVGVGLRALAMVRQCRSCAASWEQCFPRGWLSLGRSRGRLLR